MYMVQKLVGLVPVLFTISNVVDFRTYFYSINIPIFSVELLHDNSY